MLGFLVYYWINNISNILKLVIINYSVIFGIIESIFRYIVDGKFYTTHQQFIISLIFFTLFLNVQKKDLNCLLKILGVYPIMVWGIEILGHYIMKHCIYGYNPAWNYKTKDNNKLVLFDGAIRLDYYPFWVFMSLFFEIISYFIT